MKEVESNTDLSRIELGMLLMESPLSLHMEHEVSSTDEFNYKEKSTRRLETGMEAHEERMVRRRFKDMLLRLYPINIL